MSWKNYGKRKVNQKNNEDRLIGISTINLTSEAHIAKISNVTGIVRIIKYKILYFIVI